MLNKELVFLPYKEFDIRLFDFQMKADLLSFDKCGLLD